MTLGAGPAPCRFFSISGNPANNCGLICKCKNGVCVVDWCTVVSFLDWLRARAKKAVESNCTCWLQILEFFHWDCCLSYQETYKNVNNNCACNVPVSGFWSTSAAKSDQLFLDISCWQANTDGNKTNLAIITCFTNKLLRALSWSWISIILLLLHKHLKPIISVS